MTTIHAVDKDGAYVISALRTASVRPGRNRKQKGAFTHTEPAELGGAVIKGLIQDAEINPFDVDEIRAGCVSSLGKQAFIGRQMSRAAYNDLDDHGDKTPPAASNELACGSSLDAINLINRGIKSGDIDVGIGMGIEHMDVTPIGANVTLPITRNSPFRSFFRNLIRGEKIVEDTIHPSYRFNSMGNSAERVAQRYEINREAADTFARDSNFKAAYARTYGYFGQEIIPVKTARGLVTEDNGIRPDINAKKLSSAEPVWNGIHTPYNSSYDAVCAAGLLLARGKVVQDLGLEPMARIVANVLVSSNLEMQLDGPIKAIKEVLKKANLKVEDIDLFEINEAFASVVLATQKELKLDPEKINVNGGAIALGHPLGASGARLLTTLLYELERRNLKRGISSLCIGFGQGIAAIIEKV